MSVALKNPMSLGDFLDWENRQEFKYEFDGFQPVAMTGVTTAHAAIQRNLLGLLFNRLRGHRCQAYGSDLKIQVAGRMRYPDAFIVCSPITPGATVIDDPVVVFEILSPGTSYQDRIEKNREYRATPSIRRYVILEQTRPAATVYARAGDDWVADVLVGEAELTLPEIGSSISLSEVYEGVPFPSEDIATVSGA
ncbi:MAG TPA: Uma2 family endonuclease [Acetobacteraceae bacterium]